MVKKRKIAIVVLLWFVTFGIYDIVVKCKMGKQVNKICDGDGKHQMHYLLAILLGFITFGIYPVVWCCKAMNRLQDNAYRYGSTVHPAHSGGSFVLWTYLGLFIGVGPLVALCQFVSDVNPFADIYGYVEPLPYTENMVERLTLAENYKLSPVNVAVASDSPVAIDQGYSSDNFEGVAQYDVTPQTAYASGYKPINAQGSLQCIQGMYNGISFPVIDEETVVLGTNPQIANIVIEDEAHIVSGKHCSLTYSVATDKYVLVDYSTNGTYLNNALVQKNMPINVLKGDTIALGDARNMFRIG